MPRVASRGGCEQEEEEPLTRPCHLQAMKGGVGFVPNTNRKEEKVGEKSGLNDIDEKSRRVATKRVATKQEE